MAALGELRLWGTSKCPDPAVAASEPKPLTPTRPQPPGGGPSRAKGAQAEPEQSPAGRQWEGPEQPAGNSQAWGGRAGRGLAQGPLTSEETQTLNFLPQLPQLWSHDSSPGPPGGET